VAFVAAPLAASPLPGQLSLFARIAGAALAQDGTYLSGAAQPGYTEYKVAGFLVTVDNRTGLMWMTNPADDGLDAAYTYADVNSLRRYTVGDFVESSLSWTRPVRFEGAQLRSDFSTRPDLIKQELLDLKSISMTMTRESEVRSRQELKRGPIVQGTGAPGLSGSFATPSISSEGSTVIRPKGSRQPDIPAAPARAWPRQAGKSCSLSGTVHFK